MMNDLSTERRQTPRQTRGERFSLRILAIDEASPPDSLTVACTTVDVSVGGLRLRLNERIETGSRVDLSVQAARLQGKLLVSGEVRWSVQDGKNHLIGIQLQERRGFDLSEWRTLFLR